MRYVLEGGVRKAGNCVRITHEWCFTRAGFDETDGIAGLRHAHAAVVSGTDDATALQSPGL